MVEVTNELIYEVLKRIQADVTHIKSRVDDHDQQFIAIREQLHGLHGEILRQERAQRFHTAWSASNCASG